MREVSRATLAAVLVLGACTRPDGTELDESKVRFDSVPPGALITTSLGPSCETPCDLILDRKANFEAVFTLSDAERSVRVESVTDAGMLVSRGLFGGPLAVGISSATGSLFKHVPNPVRVQFTPAEILAATAEPEPEVSGAPSLPAAADFEEVQGVGPLTEGSPYDFTPQQVAAFCDQGWTTRLNAEGRTEYNPCTQRSAFR